mgnify:CR=1 FL=1|jgi:hypothetical protein|tara:strand:- start:209 stop:565 length:357 start_codon:yes stop_codon:yes gene_type:complete
MTKPIYANSEHEVIVSSYILMIKEFVKDVANDTRWNNFLDVLNTLIEYHNNYGKGVRENNYWDWVMILPINLSLMTNGFLAGIETKRNASVVRAYRVLLNEMVQDVVDKIEKLEPIND